MFSYRQDYCFASGPSVATLAEKDLSINLSRKNLIYLLYVRVAVVQNSSVSYMLLNVFHALFRMREDLIWRGTNYRTAVVVEHF